MRHDKYGAITTTQELLLFDVVQELQKLNRNLSKLSPAPTITPVKTTKRGSKEVKS